MAEVPYVVFEIDPGRGVKLVKAKDVSGQTRNMSESTTRAARESDG